MIFHSEQKEEFCYSISRISDRQYRLEIVWNSAQQVHNKRRLEVTCMSWEVAQDIVIKLDHTGFPF